MSKRIWTTIFVSALLAAGTVACQRSGPSGSGTSDRPGATQRSDQPSSPSSSPSQSPSQPGSPSAPGQSPSSPGGTGGSGGTQQR